MSTAIYVFIGYDDARRATPDMAWNSTPNGSFMEVVDCCDNAAKIIDDYLEKHPDLEYPGCFDYEATEHMGRWLYLNDEASDAEFLAELERFVDKEVADNANGNPPPDTPIQYVIQPTAHDDHGMSYPCEPSEAVCFSLFETGAAPARVWVADFLREADALAFSETLKASHL